MAAPVIIENPFIRLEVWPRLGGKVSSVIDQHDRFELLFNYPAELPVDQSLYDQPYSAGWFAGWDECFPSIAPSRYVGRPYDQIAVPDHGEVWSLPTTAVPTRDGITTVWHGLRFGYRLTRKLYLVDAEIVSEYTLINLAPAVFRFVWAQHALFGWAPPMELEFGGDQAAIFRVHQTGGEEPTFNWPQSPAGDMEKLSELPEGKTTKVFSIAHVSQPMTLRYPGRNRGLRISYHTEHDLKTYWGLMINNLGEGGQRHISLSPTTGRFDEIDRAIKDDSAGSVQAQGRCDWSVRWKLVDL